MYHQINPTETFRERQLALLGEAENRRLARQLRVARGSAQMTTTMANSLRVMLAMLVAVVALAASLFLLTAKPAHASETFTVTNTSDPGDGICGGACTLREAIMAANDTPGADTIEFNISGSGVKTINVGASGSGDLPTITGPVTIDGYTQPGSIKNTLSTGTNAQPLIELNGLSAGDGANGLVVSGSGTVIRGLVINRFSHEGILVNGSGIKIEGNFIGTDSSGTIDFGNVDDGVDIGNASNTTIGGSTPEARNLISGNNSDGVSIFGGSAGNNRVQGNLIGTKKDGTGALGNGEDGVFMAGPSNNSVGGTRPGEANTIAFNGGDGVLINVAFIQGEPSVSVGNRILSNSIFSNGQEGIDLLTLNPLTGGVGGGGSTPNDPKDPDIGGNTVQNYPVLSSAITSDGKTTIKGTLNSRPNKTFKVQFFSNPSGEGEGKKLIGQKKVSTSRKGMASITFSPSEAVAVGQAITATATGPGGNTSEFSVARSVSAS